MADMGLPIKAEEEELLKTNQSLEMVELHERADKLRYFIFKARHFYVAF